jgi:type II secretory pathway component GspD/PulD (secretin)
MNLSYSVAAFVVSAALAGPLLAQQEPNRGQAPQARPPAAQTPAPAADAPAPIVRQPSPAELETQRRRDERSVDLDELLARMSEATGMKFLVDPRVRAQVTTVPKIETPTYAELLTILRVHGYAAAEVGGRVNIVPDALARFLPTRLLQRDDDSVPDDEYVTRVLTIPNGAQLIAILRPLMPQSAHLASVGAGDDEPSNDKLIIMDTYSNVRRITEIVNTLTR